MAVADQSKSIPALLEQLFLTAGIIKVDKIAAQAVVVPSVTGGVANTIAGGSVTVAYTGAKVGDIVLASLTLGQTLPAGCFLQAAYVTAADTLTFVFTTAVATAIVGASKNFDIVVLHRS